MPFIELDPQVILKAVEGYRDELGPAQRKLDAFYRQFKCQRCGGDCIKELSPSHAFSDPDSLVPRSLLRCSACKCLFDPHTGILLELGNMADAQPQIPIIGDSK